MIGSGKKVKVILHEGGSLDGTLEFRYTGGDGDPVTMKSREGKTLVIPARHILYVRER